MRSVIVITYQAFHKLSLQTLNFLQFADLPINFPSFADVDRSRPITLRRFRFYASLLAIYVVYENLRNVNSPGLPLFESTQHVRFSTKLCAAGNFATEI